MGNFRFLSVFLKKKTVHTLKQNSYLMILAQFENLGELVKNTIFVA